MPNFNEDDPRNPLVQMLAGRPRFGNAGRHIQTDQQVFNGNPDARYFESFIQPGSEGGGGDTSYRLRPEMAQRLMRNGRQYVPLGTLNISEAGDGELNNLEGVEYDPEFGLIAPVDSLNKHSWGLGNTLLTLMMIGMGGAAASGAMAGAGATDVLAGLGASEVGTAGAAGAPAAGGAAAPAFGNVLGGSSTTAGAAGSGLAGLGAQAGVPVTDLSVAAGSSGTAAGGIGSFLGNNAGTIARLGLAGLAAGGSSGGSSGSSGGSGTPGDVNSIINAMADANRVNHSTPLGSRQWTQGPDGRWSVADTLNPAEQANFEQVQGMNSDVTGMARQRLAALLANPSPRARADAPLNVRFGG